MINSKTLLTVIAAGVSSALFLSSASALAEPGEPDCIYLSQAEREGLLVMNLNLSLERSTFAEIEKDALSLFDYQLSVFRANESQSCKKFSEQLNFPVAQLTNYTTGELQAIYQSSQSLSSKGSECSTLVANLLAPAMVLTSLPTLEEDAVGREKLTQLFASYSTN